jgi:hypothetical protein
MKWVLGIALLIAFISLGSLWNRLQRIDCSTPLTNLEIVDCHKNLGAEFVSIFIFWFIILLVLRAILQAFRDGGQRAKDDTVKATQNPEGSIGVPPPTDSA